VGLCLDSTNNLISDSTVLLDLTQAQPVKRTSPLSGMNLKEIAHAVDKQRDGEESRRKKGNFATNENTEK
jgi:hypothetical protein